MPGPDDHPTNYVLTGLGAMALSVPIGVGSAYLIQVIPIRLFLAGLIIAPLLFLGGLVLFLRGVLFGNEAAPGDRPVPPSGASNLAALLYATDEKGAEQLAAFLNGASSADAEELARKLNTATPDEVKQMAAELNQGASEIHFACPGCGRSLKVAEDRAGRQGKCPACKRPVQIPARG